LNHTEKDLKNIKQKEYLLLIGVFIIGSLQYLYQLLFRQATKIDFVMLLLLMWAAVIIYLDDIKQVTKKSEKGTLWMIVIRRMVIIIGIIVITLSLLDIFWW